MSDRVGTMNFGRGTSLAALQQSFADGDDALKLRATKNSDGTVTLFATDRPTGTWGKLTGLSQQREAARTALREWVKSELGEALSPAERKQLDTRIKTADKVDLALLKEVMAQAQRGLEGLEDLPPPLLDRDDSLGGLVLPRSTSSDSEGGLRIVPSDTGRRPPIVEDGTLKGDSMTLDEPGYKRSKVLGQGGFGRVSEFTGPGGQRVAVKELFSHIPQEEAQAEFNAHSRAMGDGTNTSHIVGLVGKTVNSSGEITGIVTEVMEGGDGLDAMNKILDAERDGRITPEDSRLIRLTMLKDMATGLGQLHSSKGVMHRDVKPENFLVSGDGVVKVSDFGTVAPESEQRGRALLSGGTIIYMSKEQLQEQTEVNRLASRVERLRDEAAMMKGTYQAIALNDKADQLEQEMKTHGIGTPADVFSLGLSGIVVLKGRMGVREEGHIQALHKALASPKESERQTAYNYLGINSNSDEDKLLRAMLSGDPKSRPTAENVASTPPLDGAEVGSPRIRKLLADVATGKI
jgi:serine/threonine protein kinase